MKNINIQGPARLLVVGLAVCTGCTDSLEGLIGTDRHDRPPQLGGVLAVEGAALLDPGFGAAGFVHTAHLRAESLCFDRFGALLVGGRNDVGKAALLTRLRTDGTQDSSFGSNGRVRIEDALPGGPAGPPGGLPSVRALLVDGLDRVLVASAAIHQGEGTATRARALIMRLSPEGAPDQNFGIGGRVELEPSEALLSTIAIDLVEDGAGGLFVLAHELVPQANPLYEPTPRAFVVRLDPGGALVETFGSGGYAWIPAGEENRATALLCNRLGRPVVAGERRGVRSRMALWRFMPDGAPDPSFGQGGEVLVDGSNESPPLDLRAIDLVEDAQGRLLVAGQRLSDPRLADRWPYVLLDYSDGQPFECSGVLWRFDSEGALDESFGTDGSRRLAMSSGTYRAYSGGDRLDLCAGMVLDAQGRILIAQDSEPAEWHDSTGWATFGPPHAALLRTLQNGALDVQLGGAGGVVLGSSGAPPIWSEGLGRPHAIAIDASGRVALAGARGTDAGIVWCFAK